MGELLSAGVLAPLRVADYRKLWIGQMVSVVGDKLNQIAMGFMVYKVTGSMLQMGIMLGVTVLPAALFGLFAGAYVDRWDRRKTMVIADVVRAGLVLTIPWAIATGGVAFAYVIAFAVAAVALFFEPAKLSLIPSLVPENELMAANSLDNATSAIAELAGLAFAGAVVAVLGYGRAFTLDAASYLFSAGMIALISKRYGRGAAPAKGAAAHPATALGADVAYDIETPSLPEPTFAPEPAGSGSSITADVAEGARYIMRTQPLRDLLALWAFAALGLGASLTVGYGLALQRYDAGAPGLALLDGAITVGLLIGTVWVGRRDSGTNGTKLLSGLTAFGLIFATVSLADSIWVAAALLLLTGIANMWFLVPSITLVQRVSREDLRGRVLAARQTITRLASAASVVAAGVAIEHVPMPVVILGVGAMVTLAAAWGWTRSSLRDA